MVVFLFTKKKEKKTYILIFTSMLYVLKMLIVSFHLPVLSHKSVIISMHTLFNNSFANTMMHSDESCLNRWKLYFRLLWIFSFFFCLNVRKLEPAFIYISISRYYYYFVLYFILFHPGTSSHTKYLFGPSIIIQQKKIINHTFNEELKILKTHLIHQRAIRSPSTKSKY